MKLERNIDGIEPVYARLEKLAQGALLKVADSDFLDGYDTIIFRQNEKWLPYTPTKPSDVSVTVNLILEEERLTITTALTGKLYNQSVEPVGIPLLKPLNEEDADYTLKSLRLVKSELPSTYSAFEKIVPPQFIVDDSNVLDDTLPEVLVSELKIQGFDCANSNYKDGSYYINAKIDKYFEIIASINIGPPSSFLTRGSPEVSVAIQQTIETLGLPPDR